MPNKKVMLACIICRMKNYKVAKSINERLILNKYCKICKKKTSHKEEK